VVYGIPGIVVDTHVKRLSFRLGLTKNTNPDKIEFDLRAVIPQDQWILFSNLLIYHGRAVCTARNPRHSQCKILNLCEEGTRWLKKAP
jgi:endonuclease-3